MRIPFASSFGSRDRMARRFRRYKNIVPIMGVSAIKLVERNADVKQHTIEFVSPIAGRLDSIKLDESFRDSVSGLKDETNVSGSLPVNGLYFLNRRHCGRRLTNRMVDVIGIRTQNTLDRLDLILVTTGRERANHVVF